MMILLLDELAKTEAEKLKVWEYEIRIAERA
jgi:hypothetical protein